MTHPFILPKKKSIIFFSWLLYQKLQKKKRAYHRKSSWLLIFIFFPTKIGKKESIAPALQDVGGSFCKSLSSFKILFDAINR